jgi:tetratricopeptide (TPR) repeat protein
LNTLTRLILASTFFTLTACTGLLKISTPDTSPSKLASTPNGSTTEASKVRDFNLDKDTLYDLIVAEVAAQRNHFNITLVNYILQARITRDPEIIKRAINAAQLLKDIQAIQEMALLWVDVDPKNIPAHQLLAFHYTLQKDYADALIETEIVLNLGGEARVDSLAIGSQQLPEADQLVVLDLYRALYKRHPENNEIGYSLALVQKNLKQPKKALDTLRPILERDSEFEAALILKINILYDQGNLHEALDLADEIYDEFPNNHNLGRLYASMLIDNKQLEKAEAVFKDLSELYPQAPSLKLSYALVMLENKKIESAKTVLLELLSSGEHQNEANFYLGRIADKNKDYASAIQYYQQVKQSIHFEPALERSSFLLAKEEGNIEEALEHLNKLRTTEPNLALNLWLLQFKLFTTLKDDERALATLDTAIEEFPADERLLYARAMLREINNDLAGMEHDLSTIIQNNPQHAIALNALGYTLANRTNRLEEAFVLIKAALTLKPENPMILDSMGWVLFKLDKKEEALLLLLKAYQTFPDSEVAAHLGEVLWVLDKKDEAQAIWQQSLQNAPNNKVLIETINRFIPLKTNDTPPPSEGGDQSDTQPSNPAKTSAQPPQEPRTDKTLAEPK